MDVTAGDVGGAREASQGCDHPERLHLTASKSRGPGAQPEGCQGSGQAQSWSGSFGRPPGRGSVTSSHSTAFRPGPQGKERERRRPQRKGRRLAPRGRTLRGGPEGSTAKLLELTAVPKRQQHARSALSYLSSHVGTVGTAKGRLKQYMYSSVKCVKYVGLRLTKL